jgi:hypothetical protein
LKTEHRDYAPRTGVDDEADVADLKVIEELGAMTLAPHEQHLAYLHTYGDHDDP